MVTGNYSQSEENKKDCMASNARRSRLDKIKNETIGVEMKVATAIIEKIRKKQLVKYRHIPQ